MSLPLCALSNNGAVATVSARNRSDCFYLAAPGLNELYVAQTGFHAEG